MLTASHCRRPTVARSSRAAGCRPLGYQTRANQSGLSLKVQPSGGGGGGYANLLSSSSTRSRSHFLFSLFATIHRGYWQAAASLFFVTTESDMIRHPWNPANDSPKLLGWAAVVFNARMRMTRLSPVSDGDGQNIS